MTRLMAWLTPVLIVQLFAALLAPSIDLGGRHLFLCDLIVMIWVPIAAVLTLARASEFRSQFIKIAAAASTIIVIAWLHGAYRPSLREELRMVELIFDDTESFNLTREFVIAFRFLCWILALPLAWRHFSERPLTRTQMKWIGAACLLAASCLILDGFSPWARHQFGEIYGHNPDYYHWRNRAYGTFSSPVEAGATIALILLSLKITRLSSIGLLALILTRAFTPMISATIAIASRKLKRLPSTKNIALSAIAALVIGVILVQFPGPRMKWLNLMARFGPWRVYFSHALTRPDILLFGYGFAPYHADNSLVFIFTRGGVLALAGFFLAARSSVREILNQSPLNGRTLLVFIAVSACATDFLIYRHVMNALICVSVPFLLAHRPRE